MSFGLGLSGVIRLASAFLALSLSPSAHAFFPYGLDSIDWSQEALVRELYEQTLRAGRAHPRLIYVCQSRATGQWTSAATLEYAKRSLSNHPDIRALGERIQDSDCYLAVAD